MFVRFYVLQFLMHSRQVRSRLPLEDHDPNSQDSGFFSVPSDDLRTLNRYFFVQLIFYQRGFSCLIYFILFVMDL